MRATATTDAPAQTPADTVVVGLVEGEGIPHDVEDGALQALVDAGEAKARFKHLAVVHAAGKRWILVGLGERDKLDDERLRVAAAVAVGRARELGAEVLCWELPHKMRDAHAARAVVEGTLMAAYRFAGFKRRDGDAEEADADRPAELLVSDHDDRSDAVGRAAVVAGAVNAARDLQNTPANLLTPTKLAERAAALDGVEVEVADRAGIEALGMGAFAAVAQGSHEEPRLIVLRYEHAEATGPVLGLVGKAVTFDSGGISIKPGQKMADMKFDMSGGAAVVEAIGAIAALGLPVRVIGVVGATENLPSGHAVKPGDVVTAKNGLTIEVNNTDAEGRMVLADCLAHAVDLGAERVVDVATLTGDVVVALGSTYAGLMADDDDWADEVVAAATGAGELLWRLPLHEEYAEMVKGTVADLNNAPEGRKASSIMGGEFLARFTGDVPWAHLDIAGTAWDVGRPYAPKGGTGVMVRTLVALAERVAQQQA
jgi:leucyl aminopeptidase